MENIIQAIREIRTGKKVLIVDDKDRENEGDIILPAEFINVEEVVFMAKEASGIICLALDQSITSRLELRQMVEDNTDRMGTAFTVSLDSKNGITTGVSAADRVKTILDVISPNSKKEDFSYPGHIYPLEARKGGVLERQGHTESSVELMKLAGLTPAAVICEVMGDDGKMLSGESLLDFANKHDMLILSIKEIIDYVNFLKENGLDSLEYIQNQRDVEEIDINDFESEKDEVEYTDVINLPTKYGEFKCFSAKEKKLNKEHLVLICGDVENEENVLVRMHSQCITSDVFGSLRCDCCQQLEDSVKLIVKEGKGVIIYLNQEGRDIGLFNKIKTYKKQEEGYDTIESCKILGLDIDNRDYKIAAKIIKKLSLRSLRLISNNPKKHGYLSDNLDIPINKLTLISKGNKFNKEYLKTKINKLNHDIKLEEVLV